MHRPKAPSGSGPPTGRLVLRPYRRADCRPVRRLWTESGLHVGPSDTCAELERMRRRDPDLFLVAERGQRLVGVVLGRFDGRRGWMNHLAVAPSERSHGIGRRLVDELERRLRRKGCLKLNLHVVRSNSAVCAFYESLGFRQADMMFLEKWLVPEGPGSGDVRRSLRPSGTRAGRPSRRPPSGGQSGR